MTTYFTEYALGFVGMSDDPECQFGRAYRSPCQGAFAFYINDEPAVDHDDPAVEAAMCEGHFVEHTAAVPTFAWYPKRIPSGLFRDRTGTWRLRPDAVLFDFRSWLDAGGRRP